jgi:transposase
MRGRVTPNPSFIAVIDLESKVRANHPLRRIKAIADKALREMDTDLTAIYSVFGRMSIPPEQLLKASLLQVIYGIRSERQLVERIDDSMTFRWFLDMSIDQEMWVPTVYSHNRDRLLTTAIARSFLSKIVEQARQRGFVSGEHFSVDGTLLQAWASIKSYEAIAPDSEDQDDPPAGAPKVDPPPKGKDVIRDFKGQKFSNDTHRSKSDPDARLARKSDNTTAKPSFLGNAMMENRSGLVVHGEVRRACGDGGETGAALAMIDREEGDHQITLAADKGYDAKDFVEQLSDLATTPHVAQNKNARRSSAVPDEIAATPEYAISIRSRKRIEQVFGWIKLAGCLRQVKIRGKAAVDALFLLALSAYNLVRMNKLMAAKA